MRAFVTCIVTLAAMACAQPALADSSYSTNWAGFAAHRSGVSFRAVSGAWKQPGLSCTGNRHTYAAFWVGLGGYSMNSTALEQIGTEADCTPQGAVVVSAWYQVNPYAVPISMTVRPGDLMTASVVVSGRRITLTLQDVTRSRTFSKVLAAGTVDVSSAEWIAEAPSQCFGQNACTILPLADFGTATFTASSAQTATGHIGSISDPAWGSTKVDLTPNGRRYAALGVGTGIAAVTSGLRLGGTSFKVTYSRVTMQPGLVQSTAPRWVPALAAAAGRPGPSIRVLPRR